MKKQKIQKSIIAMLTMIAVFALCSLSVGAAGTKKASVGKTYQIDLNKDGVKEKVKIKSYAVDKYGYEYAKVYVNGKALYTTPKDVYGYRVNMQFITCGKQVYINLNQATDNDYTGMNILLMYKGKKLVKIADFKSAEPCVGTSEVIASTSNTITVKCYAQPSQIGGILWNSTYSVKGSSIKLKSNVHKVKSAIEKRSVTLFTANKSIKFTTKVGGSKAAYYIKKGTRVKLLNIVTKGSKVYGYFQYSKYKGYLRIDPYYNTSYFKNVYQYLAG